MRYVCGKDNASSSLAVKEEPRGIVSVKCEEPSARDRDFFPVQLADSDEKVYKNRDE